MMCKTITPQNHHLELRQTLGRFATGVAVVTTRDTANMPVGITINSFCSISLQPPLVAWSIDRKCARYPVFASCQGFTISILAQQQQALAQRFARSDDAQFATNEDASSQLATGPEIPAACAWLHCTLYQRIVLGDHMMLVGRVVFHHSREDQPLVFAGGDYQRLARHGGEAAPRYNRYQ